MRGRVSKIEYTAPANINEAINALTSAGGTGRILAGGTDLLVRMRNGLDRPSHLIDVKGIEEMASITETDDGRFIVGAAIQGARLGEHQSFVNAWPGVAEAVQLIGSTQIQGRASPGGNLCNGSPAADSVPALIAAGASAIIVGPNGRRELSVEHVPVGPGRTSLADDEILTKFVFDLRRKRSADAYLRMIPRTEMDIAVAGCGVLLTFNEQGLVSDARVALGAVAPTPILVTEAAAVLLGSRLEESALKEAANACRLACAPIDDKRGTAEYRTHLSQVLFRRAVRKAANRAMAA